MRSVLPPLSFCVPGKPSRHITVSHPMIGFIFAALQSQQPSCSAIALVSFIVIQLPPGDYADGYESFLIEQGGATEAESGKAGKSVP